MRGYKTVNLKQYTIQKEQRRQTNCLHVLILKLYQASTRWPITARPSPADSFLSGTGTPFLDPLPNHCPTFTRGQLSFRYRHDITRPSSQSGQAVESLRPACCDVQSGASLARKKGGA